MWSLPVAIHALISSHRHCPKDGINIPYYPDHFLGTDVHKQTAVLPMHSTLSCKSCGSKNLGNFPAEIAIHFPGRKNLSKPHVFLFPEVLICFDCGVAQLAVPKADLDQLAEGREAGAGQVKDS